MAQDVCVCGPKKFQKGTDAWYHTFIHLFEVFMERFDIMELELMVVVARKIWFLRNGVMHGEHFFILNKCSEKRANLLMTFEG